MQLKFIPIVGSLLSLKTTTKLNLIWLTTAFMFGVCFACIMSVKSRPLQHDLRKRAQTFSFPAFLLILMVPFKYEGQTNPYHFDSVIKSQTKKPITDRSC